MEAVNKYKGKCRDCDLFCSECAKFICRKCKDIHIKQHLSSYWIDSYIDELVRKSLPQNDTIIQVKKALQDKFNEAEAELKNIFNEALNYINLLCAKQSEEESETTTKPINELNLSDKAIQALRSLAGELKHEVAEKVAKKLKYPHTICNKMSVNLDAMFDIIKKIKELASTPLKSFDSLVHYCEAEEIKCLFMMLRHNQRGLSLSIRVSKENQIVLHLKEESL